MKPVPFHFTSSIIDNKELYGLEDMFCFRIE